MTDHDALLRAICTHPGEDVPRLAYADWCDENGQGERGEFIRGSIELMKCHPSCGVGKVCRGVPDISYGITCASLRWKMFELLAMNWSQWSGKIVSRWHCNSLWTPKPTPTPHHDFARGFVSAITLPLATFTEDVARAIFSTQPVERVVLGDVRDYWNGAGHTLYLQGRSRPDPSVPPSVELPDRIFNLLGGHMPGRGGNRWKSWPSAEALRNSLSTACVAWGRELAGLPPLPNRHQLPGSS